MSSLTQLAVLSLLCTYNKSLSKIYLATSTEQNLICIINFLEIQSRIKILIKINTYQKLAMQIKAQNLK